MAAGAILSPIGLFICILIPTITILLARRPQLSAGRLAAGYIGALLALAVVIAASSYVSPQEAVSVWHVPPERYWGALIEQFVGTFAVSAFVSIVGISLVGIPTLIGLSNSGRATAPWLVLISVAISASMAVLVYGLLHFSSNIRFFETLGLFVVTHGVLAIGFALAARLPWAMRLKP